MLMRSLLSYGCLFAALGWVHFASAASFDCAKAKTYHEKFICSNPSMDASDKQLGDSYAAITKTFPLKGYIQATHRSWLASYRSCAGNEKSRKETSTALAECLGLLQARIKLYQDLTKATVYADYDDNQMDKHGGTFILFDRGSKKVLRYYGGSLTNGKNEEFWCDNEMILRNKGNALIVDDSADNYDNHSDDFAITVVDKQLTVQGHIDCGRTGIGNGKFFRR